MNDQSVGLVPAQAQLLVALALAGTTGLTNSQLRERLGAGPGRPRPGDSLRQLIARTRRQLGPAPGGREWIEHRGSGRYALHPRTWLDLAEFRTLAAAGIAAQDPERLARALSLVRGEPFAQCWYWWLDPGVPEEATGQIVATARALAEVSLSAGDPQAASRAARAGLAADPGAEELWRLLMRAEHAAGSLAAVRGAWLRCQSALAEISADGVPDPATAAVYAELIWPQR